MNRTLAATALVALTIGFLASPAVADDHKISGTFVLSPGSIGSINVERYNGLPCDGSSVSDGYSDLREGTKIRVTDDKDKTVAVAALSAGKSDAKLRCHFHFSVQVPDRPIYSIEISHRGALTYTKKKLEKMHWKLALGITDDSSSP